MLATAASALALVGAAPGQAATSGWSVVFSTHYGAAADYSGYTTVIAPGPSDAWAFGANDLSRGSNASAQVPVAVHRTGTVWQASTLPAGVTSEIIAASASDIWAVTQFGGYVLHWNGSAWSVATQLPGSTQSTGQLTGVTAFSSTDVWVFGGSGFTSGLGAWHYDGSTWTPQAGSASGISSASAVSASNIWAIGSDGVAPQDEIVHYDGTAWQPVTASALTGLQFGGSSILALSATDVWAAAENPVSNPGVWFLVHFDGSAWSQVTLPWAIAPLNLASDGQGGIWLSANDASGNAWAAQMTANGTWSRTQIGWSGTFFSALALIPGTTSLWGAGRVDTTTGSDATIWAFGVPPAPVAAVGAEGSDGQLWAQAPQLGSGWHPLGGVIIAPPAVAAAANPGAATLADPLFIGTGTDQTLWIRSATAGWQHIGTARCIGGPAAVITGSTLTVACRGTDNALWYDTASVPASGLPQFTQPWTTLGGVLSAGPAVAPVGNTVTFFVRGSNGQVYTRTASAGYAATPWNCAGQPAAAQNAATGTTTFACNAGGALWESVNAGAGWAAAVSLGGSLTGGPAVAATSQETEFFAEGTNQALWQRTPAGWTSLGGSIVGGVGAAALN